MAPLSVEIPWRNNPARLLLEQDLLSGAIPLTSAAMSSKVVYTIRPEYAQLPYASFPRRLQALRDSCKIKLDRGASDDAAYQHDCQFNRRPTFTASQKPRWEGSAAEHFLKSDITNNNHMNTTPQQLHASRSDYQVFELKVFRGHIHQEIKRRKFLSSFYGREPNT